MKSGLLNCWQSASRHSAGGGTAALARSLASLARQSGIPWPTLSNGSLRALQVGHLALKEKRDDSSGKAGKGESMSLKGVVPPKIPAILRPNSGSSGRATMIWVPGVELVELVYQGGELKYAVWDGASVKYQKSHGN